MVTQERDEIRKLARQVSEIAHSQETAAIRQRWRDVNALRKPDRAPVWCRPVGMWSELLPETELHCADPWLRGWERAFRRALIKHDIGDDEPVEEYFTVPAVVDADPPNVYGVDLGLHEPDVEWGAYSFEPPLKGEDDFSRLRLPRFTYNAAQTAEALAKAQELLGDIMPVQVAGTVPLGGSLSDVAARMIGLNELMLHMALTPAMIHRLLAYLRDTVLAAVDQAEAQGYLTPNNTGPMFCSDLIGQPTNGKYTCKNQWLVMASQEYQLIGPKMWDEFLLAYQKPIAERFGLVQYACCEDLTHKIDGVLTVPNLRVFVSSAWTDLNKVVDKVGKKHTIMWRQRASEVVFPDDTSSIEQHLERGCQLLRGSYYQIVLRELQTLAGHPRRLHDWVELAIAKAAKYA